MDTEIEGWRIDKAEGEQGVVEHVLSGIWEHAAGAGAATTIDICEGWALVRFGGRMEKDWIGQAIDFVEHIAIVCRDV